MRPQRAKRGKTYLVLVVNPGSTSTKVAVYRGTRCVLRETVYHPVRVLRRMERVMDQAGMRQAAVLGVLEKNAIRPGMLDAVAARGGLLAPCPSGTYRVGPRMLVELRTGRYGEHASNLGAIIGARIAGLGDAPAFIVDPVVVDELCAEARYSGLPDITRRSIWHALNQKAVARVVARKVGKRYERANLVVAHLGGGISVAAHRRGKAIDVNNALDGDGPFAVERTGGLPVGDLVRLAHRTSQGEMLRRITGAGGVVAYLGTNDMSEVERRAREGDAAAREVIEAMAYRIAKEIGACAAALSGDVDAVAITGALARCRPLVGGIRRRVRFIAPVHVVPGEMEMDALALGALRVLTGGAKARRYPSSGPRRIT